MMQNEIMTESKVFENFSLSIWVMFMTIFSQFSSINLINKELTKPKAIFMLKYAAFIDFSYSQLSLRTS